MDTLFNFINKNRAATLLKAKQNSQNKENRLNETTCYLGQVEHVTNPTTTIDKARRNSELKTCRVIPTCHDIQVLTVFRKRTAAALTTENELPQSFAAIQHLRQDKEAFAKLPNNQQAWICGNLALAYAHEIVNHDDTPFVKLNMKNARHYLGLVLRDEKAFHNLELKMRAKLLLLNTKEMFKMANAAAPEEAAKLLEKLWALLNIMDRNNDMYNCLNNDERAWISYQLMQFYRGSMISSMNHLASPRDAYKKMLELESNYNGLKHLGPDASLLVDFSIAHFRLEKFLKRKDATVAPYEPKKAFNNLLNILSALKNPKLTITFPNKEKAWVYLTLIKFYLNDIPAICNDPNARSAIKNGSLRKAIGYMKIFIENEHTLFKALDQDSKEYLNEQLDEYAEDIHQLSTPFIRKHSV